MADYELIEDRVISGVGLLRVPSESTKNRHITLYLSVVRPPRNRYLNRNYNPPRGKYAFLTYLRNNHVVGHADMEFEKQSYDVISDISGQTLIALKCFYEATANAFALLGTALGVDTGTNPSVIAAYENLNLLWDEVRIACYADTAIQARLYRLPYDTCRPEYDNQNEPPSPAPGLPQVPPGSTVEVNRPYPGDTVTNPNDLDTYPPLEPATIRIFYNVGANGSIPAGGEVTVEVEVLGTEGIPELRAGLNPPPGTCATTPGIANPAPPLQTTVYVQPDGSFTTLFVHNTCNLLEITSYEFI